MKPHMAESPQWTYWFERPTGEIFCEKGKAAWDLYCGRNQLIGKRVTFKYIGRSDGRLFYEAVQKAHALFAETQHLEESQQIIRNAQQAEMELAKGDQTPPINFDELGRQGQPIRIDQL